MNKMLGATIALLLSVLVTLPTLASFDVIFVDVGQGECSLIQCDGEVMVIDAGGTSAASRKSVLAALDTLGVTYINILVATHPDRDHNGYMDELILEYGADKIILPPIEDRIDNTYYQKIIAAADKVRLEKVYPFVGNIYRLGNATVTVYGPHPVAYSVDDNWSIVLMVEYERLRFLFTGDIEAVAERDMLAFEDRLPLRADVLKVAKHGSDAASSWDFIAAVQPQIAVISCAKDNRYGFPHGDTLMNLYDCGVEDVRVTYKAGNIHLRVKNGEIITVPNE